MREYEVMGKKNLNKLAENFGKIENVGMAYENGAASGALPAMFSRAAGPAVPPPPPPSAGNFFARPAFVMNENSTNANMLAITRGMKNVNMSGAKSRKSRKSRKNRKTRKNNRK